MSNDAIIDLGQEITVHQLNFTLYPMFWNDLSKVEKEYLTTWNEVKFLKDDGSDFHPQFSQVPSEHGGVYAFFIKPPFLSDFARFLVYIGRAQKTRSHNLRVRCSHYFTHYIRGIERPKITRMINQWGPYLYIRYYELDDNEQIREVEKMLIRALLPPFNDDIPDQQIKRAVKAFL